MAETNEEKYDIIIEDDMTFPKATIDPKLIRLQKEVTEFVTSVILKHEKEFCELVLKNFPAKVVEILGSTRQTIITMITEVTNKFYNQIYFDIQNKKTTPLTTTILEMSEFADYGPHILLDKLIRLTFTIHLDIVREDLNLDDLDSYNQSVLDQINKLLLSAEILHKFSKGQFDNVPFVNIPPGQKPFNIVIDKEIRK
jgi:hypothetical protein